MGDVYTFIEAMGFTDSIQTYFGADEAYSDFQSELVASPNKGSVITGASPLRKLHWGDKRRGMGKRGGLRIIYLHIPEIHVIFLLDVHGKDESEDLSSTEKRELQVFAKQLVEELKQRYRRGFL